MGLERLEGILVFREHIGYHLPIFVKLFNLCEVAGDEGELSDHSLVIFDGELILGLVGLSHVVDELEKSV